MSPSLLASVRRRSARVWGVSLLLIASAALGTTAPAAGAPPVSATISVTAVRTPTITVPDSPGAGDPFVVSNVAFDVSFATDVALSNGSSTRLSLTATSGPDKGLLLATYDLPADATSGTFTGAVLPTAANGVGLKITAKSPGVAPGTTTIDVLRTYVSADSSSTLTGIGGGGGPGVPCTPTPADQTCGDLIMPSSSSVASGSNQLLSQGVCAGVCSTSSGSVLQWLAQLVGVTRDNPVVFVAKCDKSLCSGKGIKSYSVKVQLTPTSTPTTATACAAKGVVDPDKLFCTDYVQSTRDGAGDVLLYVLFAEDAKIIW